MEAGAEHVLRAAWDGHERRAFPRFAVDCAVSVVLISGAAHVSGRIPVLSLSGCRVVTDHPYPPEILVRLEAEFSLRGMVFRVVGVSAGSRGAHQFAVRFLDLSTRTREGLAAALDEIAAAEAGPEVG